MLALTHGQKWPFIAVFNKKIQVVCPLIVDERFLFLTPLMFVCHKSHSYTLSEDNFFVKNQKVLAFGIVENDIYGVFYQKMPAM